MTLQVGVEVETEGNFPTRCAICGRMTGSRTHPTIRFPLFDSESEIGEVCERCAYGPTDAWRLLLMDYAVRLEEKAAILRDRATRAVDGEPIEEEVVIEVLRSQSRNQRQRPPGMPPWLRD